MGKKNPYEFFPNYVLRTPLLSLTSYKNLTSNSKISDEAFKSICKSLIISEAIFLASPSFHSEIQRWLQGELKNPEKVKKLKYSILKYYSRMTSRCTPFGLFAGCTLGSFGEETTINIQKVDTHRRHTRLDMNFLVALSQDLSKTKVIQEQLLFYPNSSIYKIGDKSRYVEYYYENSIRFHEIVAVDHSIYLERVIQKAFEGATVKELAELLVEDDITFEDARGFIDELITSQILISELEPTVSGPEFMTQIYQTLDRIDHTQEVLEVLKEAEHTIKEIDSKIGNSAEIYIKLSDALSKLGTKFDLKYMFQTDMFLTPKKNMLNEAHKRSFKRGFEILSKITFPQKNTLISQFTDAFYERYQEREVPLSQVLDVETGIGYRQGSNSGDFNLLIDDLPLPPIPEEFPVSNIQWSKINAIFHKKVINAFKNEDYTIVLKNEDFKDIEAKWDDFPDTMSFMVEIVKIEGTEMLVFGGGGGSSAANLLGRFCHGDSKIMKHTESITKAEEDMSPDKILAEIVHLPESRAGNILMRPTLRKHEIPYLAKSTKANENQITLDDLMISRKNRKGISLKSQKHNKEVVPHLTTAHNYSSNSLPIYHFLCDMQTQGMRKGVRLDLGPFAETYEFLPRIMYENIIFHNATWNLKPKHVKPLMKDFDFDEKLLEGVEIFRKKFEIPQYIMLADRDNELLVNLHNLTSIRMFLDMVHKRDSFVIKEFLFDDDGIVSGENGSYTNQIILSIYNKEKLQNHG